MCTGFVRRGKDVIVGFNMDINVEALEYQVYAEPDKFYIGADCKEIEAELTKIPGLSECYQLENHVRKIHGINSNGNFGNQLNNMDFHKAPFMVGTNVVSIDQIIDDYISGKISFDQIVSIAQEKEITQIPKGAVDIPSIAFHSIITDKAGRIMILEPGNGYSIIKEKYAVLSNFPILELPGDFSEDRFGYYGKDRYDTAMNMLRESTDDFDVKAALKILESVKQVGRWGTRVSFVYSNNENAVYYCLEGQFNQIQKHSFKKDVSLT